VSRFPERRGVRAVLNGCGLCAVLYRPSLDSHGPSKADPAKLLKSASTFACGVLVTCLDVVVGRLADAFIVTTYDEEEKGTKLVARPAQTLVVADGMAPHSRLRSHPAGLTCCRAAGCIQWNKKGEIIRRLKLSDLTDVFVASKSLVPTVLPAKKVSVVALSCSLA
jgi:hypothetical protein